jgi:LysR family transcriptional regulator for metE and metH
MRVMTTTYPIKPPLYAVTKATNYLPNVLMQMEAKAAGLDNGVFIDPSGNVGESSNMNVAFVTADKADAGITLEPLFADEVRVIVAPHHRFASRPYVRATEILEETLLTYSDLKTNIIYDQLLVPRDLEPKKHLQVRLTEAMIEFIKAGVGVAVMAQWAVAPYVASGAVVAVPLTKRGVERLWKAAYLASRPMPPFVRAFIDMIAAQGPRAQRMAITLPMPKQRRA